MPVRYCEVISRSRDLIGTDSFHASVGSMVATGEEANVEFDAVLGIVAACQCAAAPVETGMAAHTDSVASVLRGPALR